MQELLPSLLIAIVVIWAVGSAVAAGIGQTRRDRRKIMAEGTSAQAIITKIIGAPEAALCRVSFIFRPPSLSSQVECNQIVSRAGLALAGLAEGATVRVYYLPKHPKRAFIDSLAVAERVAEVAHAPGTAPIGPPPLVYFISYTDSVQRQRSIMSVTTTGLLSSRNAIPNAFRWTGSGDLTLTDAAIYFTASRMRLFWLPKTVRREFARDAIVNVEAFENTVRCEIQEPGSKPRTMQFWTVNASDAKAIAARLPETKNDKFAPQLAEQAQFTARLLQATPRAPVTPTLIAINVAVFVLAALMGGGTWIPDPEVMIRLGSNYTPLTLSGEWWRLLTSTFLHFGLVHLAFNMWALWAFGLLAERLFGSSRYLLIYLTAGITGSLASFLWHPFVNSAGASGAIFGVLGSLLAFFLRTDQGVPQSVLKRQRTAPQSLLPIPY